MRPTVTSDDDLHDSKAKSRLPLVHIGDPSPDLEAESFSLNKALGEGGMGAVYSARQATMDREVAIKRSHKSAGAGSSYGSVLQEGRLVGRLDHPNIPPVHLLGKDEQNRAVLVMKRIEGDSWHSMLKNPYHPRWTGLNQDRLTWNLSVLIQVCRALEHAHSRAVIHRDIKSDNVMIGDFGQVYLIDWGIAIEADGERATTGGHFVGTPGFVAPEMVIQGAQQTPATDVYLLGGTLNDVLTGMPPHQGGTLGQMVLSARASEPINYPQNIHPELVEICHRAMHVEPDHRYSDVGHFREAIEVYVENRFTLGRLYEAQQMLVQLEEIAASPPKDGATASQFIILANRCRFTFEQVATAGVEISMARAGLLECIEIQLRYAVFAGELRLARVLLADVRGIVPEDTERLNRLATFIAEARVAQSSSKDELNTQIQYQLIEQLQALQSRSKASVLQEE